MQAADKPESVVMWLQRPTTPLFASWRRRCTDWCKMPAPSSVAEEAPWVVRSLLSGEPRRHPSSRAHLHPMEPLNPLLGSKDRDARALPARDPVDPAAPVDLVQRRVLPVDRVRPSWLATSLLRSRSRPLRCRGDRGRTLLRTCCCLPHCCAGVLSAQRCEGLIPGG